MRRGEQPPWIVPDGLWARIEPLLPVVPRRTDHPGRKRLDDRKVLSGILFVLYTGIPWEFLPQELGFGSGMTCWRRLRDWNDAGVWQRLHESLLAELNAAGALDWSRAVIDGSHVRALKGGPKTGPSPVDRARTGSKHHLITEGHGIPLAVSLTGGNRNDVTQLIPLIQAVPPVRGRRGRPRQRPVALYADRGYDHDKYRKQVRALGITPVIARRGVEHGSGLGVHRWVVEQSFALLHWFRRLRIRWEIRDDIHEAFLSLACGIICWRRLVNLSLC
ncbi:IS5 family transposase (plasmid) [Streptomyces sp. NBC_01340]|uniref:IS5 family transposase n=1 Tax=unclassified Streptomyces TaxID=2593676 RepID=UPI002257C96B|nr:MULTISPECIES: IS5 family transposase [unclassified Streptomyces]MCX4461140.1 IS5 family transposase [Streptomyces sp. NBC_01719]MCX4461727.1 IS5 family transposase [Streptomyces sp. NBC_01719]MCX4490636.1 IS5 family transposase [Streptomyces sp. NBC_01728]MCX4499531.1 IS5 family transposase [Streptomyces sp. NBC_01728]MCX4597371.1 IS5 family transposase [Streptomyces sp. NBC_01549]